MQKKNPQLGDLVTFDEENQKYNTPWQNQIGIIIETHTYEHIYDRCCVQWPDGSISKPEVRILEVLNEYL